MEQINSLSSRKLSPIESMQKLEKACYASDVRLNIRNELNARARVLLGLTFSTPLIVYVIYNLCAPSGVM